MTKAPFIETGDAALCTGCGACSFSCPAGAISMMEDNCGFVYPAVDGSACVGCGRCFEACHMARHDELKAKEEPITYGAYDRDPVSLRHSASGGVATLLCRGAVDRGGVAYGCVAHRENVYHERLATPGDLERARGSKYVQSDIASCFPEIASDLASGLEVVFVGTPCQCAAMRAVFGERENLLLIDLVCEGVPSRRMYADFLDNLEVERGKKVSDFRFRDKRGGWSTKNAVVIGEDDRPLDWQPHSYCYYYYWLFTKGLILRDSCYTCPYACARRVGDVTVGDFWDVETTNMGYRSFEIKGGISCALVSTSRGEEGLSALADDLDVRPSSFEIAARSNCCLVRPSSCDKEIRTRILNAYIEFGAEGMKASYHELFGLRERVTVAFLARIPPTLRIALKQLSAMRRGACRG